MGSLSALTIRAKLNAMMVLIGLLFAGVWIVSSLNMNVVSENNSHLNDQYLPVLIGLLKADTDLHQVMLAERSVLLNARKSDELHKEYYEEFSKNIEQALERIEGYQSMSDAGLAPDMSETIAKIKQVASRWEMKSDVYLTNISLANQDDIAAHSITVSEPMFSELTDLIDSLLESTVAQVELEAAASKSGIAQTRWSLSAASAIGIAIAILLIALLPMMITRNLQRITEQMQEIAEGEGDLTKRMHIKSGDEIGQLAQAFDTFLEHLHRLISNVVNVAHQLSDHQENLMKSVSASHKAAADQQMDVDGVSTATHEMSITANEVAQNAEYAAKSASRSKHATDSGLNIAKDTRHSVNELSGQMAEAARVISQLQEKSLGISSVIEVINNIAEQTNLLALNAAIEAARAGEQGRGFAVVADEVRALAGKTQQSTTEIAGIIEELQGTSSNAVNAIEQGVTKTEQVVQLINDTESSLSTIAQAIDEINQVNNQVASASEEQKAVNESINERIHSISDQATIAAESAHGSAQSSEAMNELNGKLQILVSRFKI